MRGSTWRRGGIRTRLVGMIMTTCFVSLMLACAGFIIYDIRKQQDEIVDDLTSVAEIVGANSSAAILFNDSVDAAEVLNALSSRPHILSARLFRSGNQLLATYPGNSEAIPDTSLSPADGRVFGDGQLTLVHPVVFRNSRIGTIVLVASLSGMTNRLLSYIGISIAVLLGSLSAAFFVATIVERRVSLPILRLAQAARSVSVDRDFTVRVPVAGNDEVAELGKSFNDMLEQVQLSDTSLRHTNQVLRKEIAERRKAEAILAESEARFRHLFDNHPLPMWVYDTHSLGFLEVNDSAVGKYGYSREEFLNMTIEQIRPASEVPALHDHLRQDRPLLQFSGPWKHTMKNGREIDVEILSHKVDFSGHEAALVVALDITERRKAQLALQLSEERYRTLMEASTSVVWTTDAEGNFVEPQKQWQQYTGQAWEGHRGFGWSAMLHPDDRPRIVERWNDAVRKGALYEVEGRVWHAATGTYRFFNARAVAMRNAGGDVREWIGTVTDIHDRRKAEHDLFELNMQLEQRVRSRTEQLTAANKELEMFSYSVSHDLRAPLRAIEGFSRILQEEYSPLLDSEGHRLLGVIRNNTNKMGKLIDDLLAFSRVSRIALGGGAINMETLARSVFEECRQDAQGRAIEFTITPLPLAHGDMAMVRQVLVNLFSNALKFTRPRATAIITMEGEEAGTMCRYRVSDNGVGFDMKYLGKLFGVFQRLHKPTEFEGTGVGLAIVQRIVHRHGGIVTAESAVDKGTTIIFTLPKEGGQNEPG